jgi:outer membrane protein OmpA-like peptidoglycan-associated protein
MAAQEQYSIRPLFDINTRHSESSVGLVNGQLLVLRTPASKNRKIEWPELLRKGSAVALKRGDDFSSWEETREIIPKGWGYVGPVSYSAADSTLFFSSAKNFGNASGRHIKIYSSRWDGRRWSNPNWINLSGCSSDNLHPYFDASCNTLVFASNRNGGCGEMDIWYSMRTADGWSQAINPGLGVNSSANELCPTIHRGDIFYATNRVDSWGGYDIRRALGGNQWRTSVAEGAPINSAADEMGIAFLTNEKGVLTSNRLGGKGGTDLFLLSREPRVDEMHDMKLFLTCAGEARGGVEVVVRNESGEMIQQSISNEFGQIDIQKLRLNQSYLFQLKHSGDSCRLVLKDPFGNLLKEVSFDSKGMALLELLPFQFSKIQALHIDDGSLLSVTFDGQLYQEKPGDIGRGEPIMILNSSGEVIALAYTNDLGRFRFSKLDPQLSYVMKLSAQTDAKRILITDSGRKIDLPVLNAEINYTRVSKQEAIELVNELNDTVRIASHDLFVINRMYYDYDCADITSEASMQLDKLAIIMERNPDITLQLLSHTDSRGDADYNLSLSQRRACSAIHYLSLKGISENRCSYKGLGETQLMNECSDGVACSEPEHAINRRTEIRLERPNHVILSGR